MKPATYILLLLAISLAFLSSCSEEFSPASISMDREAVVLAELEVGKLIDNITISSTFSPQVKPIFPNAEEFTLDKLPSVSNTDPNGQKNKGLRYKINEQKWFHPSFRFQTGHTITLEADLTDFGMEPIFASTTAPYPGEISDHSESLTAFQNKYVGHIQLSTPELEDNYYHIIAYSAEQSSSPDKDFLDLNAVAQGSSVVFPLSHMDGILIDIDRMDVSNDFEISIDKSDSSSNPSHIYLKIKTVAKEYYDFHRSLSLQAESEQGPFDAPFPTVSNIERGQGLFTAYAVTMDSIRVE